MENEFYYVLLVSHQVQVIHTYENKNYDHNLVIEDFGDQKRIFRNRAI